MTDLMLDLRLALRRLGRAPGFAVTVVLTLVVSIAMSTALFSVVRGVLLEPLPVREQDRLVVLWGENRQKSFAHLPFSYTRFPEFVAGSRQLSSIAGVDYNGAFAWTFREGDRPLRLKGSTVTGNFFEVLGVRPVAGRLLVAADDRVGAAPVLVLSHELWQSRFGGDSTVIGRSLFSHDRNVGYTIVGVAPPGLEYPRGVQFWSPIVPFSTPTASDSSWAAVDVVGRLAPGATEASARSELTTFYDEAVMRPAYEGAVAAATSLATVVTGDVRPVLVALSAAVALVMLIAIGNIANLQLLSGLARERELVVRMALGARTQRMVAQLAVEALVLTLIGGVVGAGVAYGVVEGLADVALGGWPRLSRVEVDGAVLAFAALVTGLAALGCGVAPAIALALQGARRSLRLTTRGANGSRRGRRARQALVAWQVALAVVVLAGAGLVTRSLGHLTRTDLGVTVDRLALVQVTPDWTAFGKEAGLARWRDALDQIVAAIAATPGVTSASPVTNTPFSGAGGWDGLVTIEGTTEDQARVPWLNMESTGATYAATAGLTLRAGRFLADADREDAPRVVVLSEEAARRMYPRGDAVGKRVRFAQEPWRTVVGVVSETRYRDLYEARPTIYLPYRQFDAPSTYIAVRSAADPASLATVLPSVVSATASGTLAEFSGTMEGLLSVPLAKPRLTMQVFAVFALVAVLLATLGIVGVAAASVEQRRAEIGVRMALGAAPRQVMSTELRSGMWVAVGGVVAGLGAAVAFTGGLRAVLHGVQPNDPLTLAVVTVGMLVVSLMALLIPARRASQVNPLIAMRAD